jgi:hypothetical protein
MCKITAITCDFRYNMMFVPFTGIDNHKKSVSIGAGLLMDETTDSYTWLLKAFLKTFGGQPRMVVTDQDAAMKKAIALVFPESRHRLCMWHITQKLPLKVKIKLYILHMCRKLLYRLSQLQIGHPSHV